MEIKNKKLFNNLIKSLTEELLDEEEDLIEMTSTSNVDGYNTPFAFRGKDKKSKKKNKEISTNSTGYSVLDEKIEPEDVKKIKVIIRHEVGNIIRDIWLKRTSWKKV